MVVDEYGGVTGLTTMGDLLEAIFGDIPTPSDEAEDTWVHELPENRFALPGTTPIEDFNARFDADFEVEEVRTLGGLVLHHFGELPTKGEDIVIDSFRFWARQIDANRIAEVMVEPRSPDRLAENDAPVDPAVGDAPSTEEETASPTPSSQSPS